MSQEKEEIEDFSSYLAHFKPVDVVQLHDILSAYYDDSIDKLDTDREDISQKKFEMMLLSYSGYIMKYLSMAAEVQEFFNKKRTENVPEPTN